MRFWPAADPVQLEYERLREMALAGTRTLYSIFAEYARLQPDREWLVFERDDRQIFRWTYGEFFESINRAANLLRLLGVEAGDVMAQPPEIM